MALPPRKRDDVPGPMGALRHEMNRLFDDFFAGDLLLEPFHGIAHWRPAVDVSETENSVVVKAELPGLESKDVEVSLSGDILTIKGEKKEEKEEKTKSYHRVERHYGSFERAVRLPASVDAEKVEAAFKNGVLTVELPKTEEAKKKAIHIKVE